MSCKKKCFCSSVVFKDEKLHISLWMYWGCSDKELNFCIHKWGKPAFIGNLTIQPSLLEACVIFFLKCCSTDSIRWQLKKLELVKKWP